MCSSYYKNIHSFLLGDGVYEVPTDEYLRYELAVLFFGNDMFVVEIAIQHKTCYGLGAAPSYIFCITSLELVKHI